MLLLLTTKGRLLFVALLLARFADVRVHLVSVLLRQADALAVEPVLARVAPDVPPGGKLLVS